MSKLSYTEQAETVKKLVTSFLKGNLCDLPLILTGESGSGKSYLLKELIQEIRTDKLFKRFLPIPDMSYNEMVNHCVKALHEKHTKDFQRILFWFDECHHWNEFKPEFIQSDKGFILINGIRINFDQLIFSGHSTLISSKSDKARLRELTLQSPERTDIFNIFASISGYDIEKLSQVINFSGKSLHEVRKNYRSLLTGERIILNPLGLSDNALKALSIYSGDDVPTFTACKAEMGLERKAMLQVESELLNEKLMRLENSARIVTHLGYRILSQSVFDSAKPEPEPEPEPEPKPKRKTRAKKSA